YHAACGGSRRLPKASREEAEEAGPRLSRVPRRKAYPRRSVEPYSLFGRRALPPAERVSATGVMGYAPRAHRPHYGVMLAAKITLPHFMVLSTISLAKSAGEPGSTVAPRLASRAWKLASARLALTCVFNLLMISAGAFLGAPMPYQLRGPEIT